MDRFIVETACCSFVIFFILQCIVLRALPVHQVLKGLMNAAIGGGVLNLVLTAGLSFMCLQLHSLGTIGFICLLFLSFIVYGLLVFVYILCVFGPYETSIRMRIVREIHGAGQQGLTLENLLRNYNIRKILQVRLERLKGAGDIVLKDGKYHIHQHYNMFFVIEIISQQIQKWIGPRSPLSRG